MPTTDWGASCARGLRRRGSRQASGPALGDRQSESSHTVRPMQDEVQAFWLRAPGRGEIRPVALPEPGPGDVRRAHPACRASAAAPRRSSSAAACRPTSTRAMRAPFQEGDFPGPVKYGYLNVGVVEQGPPELRGRTVFCLYPHQTAYVVPAGAVAVVPEGVPAARAVLAGTVETAVNALWDAAPLVGDRVAVVGAGMVGCCVARLLQPVPGVAGDARRRRPGAGRRRGGARRRLRAAGRRRRRPRPRRAHQRDVGRAPARRSTCSRPRAPSSTSAGTATREVRLSLGGAFHSRPPRHPLEPGRRRLPGPRRAPHDRRPAGARARPAARPRLRRAAHRRVAASTSCPR